MAYEIRLPKQKEKFIQGVCSRLEFHSISSLHKNTGESGETGDVRGISSVDVLRVFLGARVLTEDKAKTLKDESASERMPQQLRLILGGKP